MGYPEITPSGDLRVAPRVTIAAGDIRLRVTTPGGPGGQHANRTQSRVIASVHVDDATSLRDEVRERLRERLGPIVSASASTSRSQARNREDAMARLGRKIAEALVDQPRRRATRPTTSSVERRLSEKKRRSSTKATRRARDDD